MKLDIGSQAARFKDFTTVDLYASEADIKADICDMPFPDGSVDEIWASHVIEHIPPPKIQKALRECLRVLKPGATARFALPDLDDACRAWLARKPGSLSMIFGECGEQQGQVHYHGWGPLEFRAELQMAGFHVISVQTMQETAEHNLGGTYWHNMVNIFAEVRKPL